MVIIFAICFAYLLYMAFSFMKMTSEWGESIAAPTKVHPELKDVKQGDQLLVVNFTQDPLHASLQNRINKGMEIIDDPWYDEDDEDDDGDGDVPAIVRR